MEDRLETEYSERPGLALTALVVILVVTAAWWALALWPIGAEPDWLTRTRAACFGSGNGRLPHAGGWIVLLTEPVGMLLALRLLWGESLKRDLAFLTSRRAGRLSLGALAVIGSAFALTLGVRIARALPDSAGYGEAPPAAPVAVDRPAPDVVLVDQHGREVRMSGFGRKALVTFAFGQCQTVCPGIVSGLKTLRSRGGYASVPIIVVSVDPWRDTPSRLPWIAEHWTLDGNDIVLSGSVENVNQALGELGIPRERDLNTGDITHVATVMLMTANGRIAWRADGGTALHWSQLPL